jgi:hypothetical protein
MVFLRKFGAWFATALMLSMPALACFDRTDLTPAERECCQQMADKCGSMNMPDSHSCCTPTIQHNNDLAVLRTDSGFTLQLASAPVAEQVLSPEASTIDSATSWLLVGSPPESPPKAPTILRI